MNINQTGPIPQGGNGHTSFYQPDLQEKQVTLQDYLRILYKGRYIIIISFLAVMVSTIYFTFSTEPVYEASAKIMIEDKGGVGESLFDVTSMMKKETMINNQVEILKSRTLAENVIRDLQASEYADRMRILGYDPQGKSTKRSGILTPIKNMLSGLFAKHDNVKEESEDQFDEFVKTLRSSIEVTPIRNTDMIEIKVSAFSPFEAAYLTNAVASAYERMNRMQSQAEVRQVKNFLEEQLDQYKKELAQSENALKNYKQQAKVVALDQETQELVQKLSEFESLYNEAKTDYEANRQRLAYIDKQLAEQKINVDIQSISSQPYLAELKRQIAEKESEMTARVAKLVELGVYEEQKDRIKLDYEAPLEALKKKFKEEVTKAAATDFVDQATVANNLFTSKIEVETELQSLEPKLKALKRIVDQYNAELEALPEKSLQLARLMRKAQVDEKIYIMLQEKYQESRITEVGQLGNVRIIDPAKEPKYPVKPKKKLNLMLGVLIGLGLGIGISFMLEYLDNSVRTMEDIESVGQSVIATIPFIKPEQRNGVLGKVGEILDPEAADISERLITHLKPKSPISEAYRTFRTNITFATPDKKIQSLLVTSSGPKEGKSTTVSNLAITFAQMGMKTLLIDSDLRRPILHKLFNLDKRKGLTNVLVGQEKLQDVVQTVPELPEELYILSCGILPPNPAELLGSRQMESLLQQAKQEYEMILLDTPPTIAVTDSSVLAPLVDGVLLVVKSGSTHREAFIRALEQLQRIKAPLLGVVLNSIQAANVYGSYYYYYYYHYYYGPDGEKTKTRQKGKRQKKQASKQTV